MAKMLDDDFNESEMFDAGAARIASTPIGGGNPLAGYFRMPGLSVGLPTGGRYLPAGAVTLDATGKVEVFPMRSADELLLKSPDALMSGLAIEKLIESCIPAIKTPSLVSAPDLDVLLLAIRAATYGNTMAVEVSCPRCEAELEFECDLAVVLSTVTNVPENLDLRLSNDVVVGMRPHSLASQTSLLLAAYEEQRKAHNLEDETLDDLARQRLLSETLTRLTGFQTQSLSDAITKISIPGQDVTDRGFIMEFVEKTTKEWSKLIQAKLEEINTMGVDRTVPAHCTKCDHQWSTTLEFNPATFFEQGS